MKISVIGGGSWGLALASVLSNNNHDILVYDVNPKIVRKINTLHICMQLDERIPEDIKASSDIKSVVDYSDVVLFTVPTKVLRVALQNVIDVLDTPKLFINAAKGIEPETFLRVSEIFSEMVPKEYLKGFVALSGPSHAEEVIQGMTTVVTCASNNEQDALFAQHLFHNNDYFRVYS